MAKPPLQREPPEDDAPRDRAAVVREKDGDPQDGEHPEEAPDPIGDVEQVERFGHRKSP